MSRKIRSAALVLALSVLFVSSAYAAPRATAPAKRAPGFLTAAWSWFASLVSGGAGDPEGRQPRDAEGKLLSSTLSPWMITEAGSSMDPDGIK